MIIIKNDGRMCSLCLKPADQVTDFLFCFSEFVLQPAEQLLLFALDEGQVIVRQVCIQLFEFSFDDIPIATYAELYHDFVICVIRTYGEP